MRPDPFREACALPNDGRSARTQKHMKGEKRDYDEVTFQRGFWSEKSPDPHGCHCE